MADSIQQLPDHVADQIAAGEVVERPASVVKELLENSLDAGATEIEVEFSDGGINYLSVSDDGSGIPPADLELAIQRHATSKIESADDLNKIRTLGFRGEALASIAAVSDIRIVSRVEDEDEAYELTKSASGEPEIRPAPRKPGTTVEIKKLFETVPARRRFLKTENTERKHLIREVHKKILSHTNVHFRLNENDRQLLSVPPADLEERIHETLSDRDVSELLSIERLEHDWKGNGRFGLTGLISDGETGHRSRSNQFLFVNDRSVSDPVLYKAISKAYEKLGLTENNPMVVLFLDLPGDQLDINVHPRKEKIRYNTNNTVFRFAYEAIKNRLEEYYQDQARTTLDPEFGEGTPEPSEHRAAKNRLKSKGSQSETSPKSDIDENSTDTDDSADLFTEKESADGKPGSSARVLGQFRDTFLVVERDDGLLLIDQHTAHERVLYEQYRSRIDEREPAQMLSVPLTLELPDSDQKILLDRSSKLEDLGLCIEEFGSGSLVIQGIPGYLGRRSEDRRMIYDMVEEFLEWENEDRVSDPAESMITIMACRSAVMKGDRLMPREQKELINGLNELDFPGKCPHGRRIFKNLTNDDISKWFERPPDDLCSR